MYPDAMTIEYASPMLRAAQALSRLRAGLNVWRSSAVLRQSTPDTGAKSR